MTRTFATATAIATALIAVSPAGHAGQMINVPTPQVNVAPNVPRPKVNLPAVTPRPDTSRVRESLDPSPQPDHPDEASKQPIRRDDAGDVDDSNVSDQIAKAREKDKQTEALADNAPMPPAFPETLVKAMDVPPFRPRPKGEAVPGPWPPEADDEADDGDADNLGDAGEINTGGSGGDASGIGNGAPFGGSDADRLREQFRGGISVERAEELARLKELQELGWLEFGDSAFDGDGGCGPGVNLPAGTDLHGLGCGGGGDAPETDSGPGDDKGFLGGMPLDPDHGHGGYPMPSPEDGMGGNEEHENAWIGGGGGSATGNAGVKDFGVARLRQDPDSGSGDDDSTPDMVFDEKGRVIYEEKDDNNGKGHTSHVTFYFDDGSKATYHYQHEDDDDSWGTPLGTTFFPAPDSDEEPRYIPPGGGQSGQPDPRGPRNGGGAGQDCLMLGTRCDVAENESGETWGEKMKEWARTSGLGSGGLTPGKVMEQAGQPVPVPGRENGTDKVDDPRAEAGLTPGCDADPGGCGGGAGGTEAAGAAADDALDDAALDTSIAGITPGCDADPGGCGGRMGAAAEAAVESDAGEEAR